MKIDWLKITEHFYFTRKNLTDICWHLLSFLYIRVYLIIALVLNIFNWVFVYYISSIISQNLVILHYNVNFGVNLIGDISKMYIIPAVGLFFILLNLLLIINIYKENKFVIHLLLVSSIVVNLFLLMSVMALYLINFR
ncbi:MAG: hypothetical protein Q7T79_00400 [bacterium]|nr:hypothetical protein [bacterium]